MVPLKPPTDESTIGLAIVLNTSKFLILGSKTWSEKCKKVDRQKSSEINEKALTILQILPSIQVRGDGGHAILRALWSVVWRDAYEDRLCLACNHLHSRSCVCLNNLMVADDVGNDFCFVKVRAMSGSSRMLT